MKEKDSKQVKLILVSSISLVLLLAFILIFYSFWYIGDVRKIPIEVEVGDSLGMDTNSSLLKFGRVLPGGGGIRKVVITNSHEYPVKVSIKKDGETEDWVTVSKNDFYVEPGAPIEVDVKLVPPLGTEYGKYYGHIKIVMTK